MEQVTLKQTIEGLAGLKRRVRRERERFVVLCRGTPAFAIVPLSDLERLEMWDREQREEDKERVEKMMKM